MIMKNLIAGAAAGALILTVAAGADAQTRRSSTTTTSRAAPASTAAAPAASAVPLTHGAPIAGFCIYSNARVLETSTVGKAFATRMQQLRAQAAAEVSGQQTALQNDEKVLQGKRATLSQEQFAQQAQPLAQREQTLQQTAEQRSRELQATYAHQVQRLGEQIEPLVRAAYEQHHCAVLLNGEAIMAGNPAMDLTDQVTQALNAKMTTITFDREAAPAQ
jgi:Skp family chaperone for outer membrane proteins